VAEENDSPETGAEASAAGVDPAAIALALGSASRDEADGFLRDQRRLTALQISRLKAQDGHFHEEAELELAHLRWRRFEDRMKGATRLILVAAGTLLLGAVVAALWEASQAEGLVVDSFSVPPAFAASGVAADVLADDLTTRLAAIRDFATDHSLARSKDVNQDRNQDIKVEIPDTGIALTQAWRYLKLWLGHERRLTGNLRDMGDGKIALTVALDGGNAVVLQGSARDLDKLEDQAAEKVFGEVDPVNYVLYLSGKGRYADGLAAAAHLALLAKTPTEMSDGYALWANETHYVTGDLALAMARARIAIAQDPKTTASHMELMNLLTVLGHDEEAFAQAGRLRANAKRTNRSGATPMVSRISSWKRLTCAIQRVAISSRPCPNHAIPAASVLCSVQT
jgi:hypothetical protein